MLHELHEVIGVLAESLVIGGQRFVLGRIEGEPHRLTDRGGHHPRGVPGLRVNTGSVPGSACHLLHGAHSAAPRPIAEPRTGVGDYGYPGRGTTLP
jgi:hypothetical protein